MINPTEELTEKINQVLQEDQGLGVYALKARVYQDGIVQIQGIVDVLEEKHHAEVLVSHLPGVKKVENDITVCTDGAVNDGDVAFEVGEELRANPEIPESVGVRVFGGQAQLVGSVSSRSEVNEAIETARKARGVRQVNHQLKYSEDIDDVSIINTFQDTLMEELDLTPGKVRANATAGIITLSGNLSKDNAIRAERIASEITGVKKVRNEINSDKVYTETTVEEIIES